MTQPRARACTPPRMAVLIDGHEVKLMPPSLNGPRIDLVHETADRDGTRTTVTVGATARPGTPPVAPRLDDLDRRLAAVLVQAGAATIEDHDITLTVPPLVPLPADWVSPTLGTIPPGGVAPGQPLSPHCHDRRPEPSAPAPADWVTIGHGINGGELRTAPVGTEPPPVLRQPQSVDIHFRTMWLNPRLPELLGTTPADIGPPSAVAQEVERVEQLGGFQVDPQRHGWLRRALDRAFGGRA